MSLAAKLLLSTSLTLLLLSLAGFAVLSRAQSQLAMREMDASLETQAYTLSGSATQSGGKVDFEISPLLLSQIEKSQKPGFFRFTSESGASLLASHDAPATQCRNGEKSFSDIHYNGRTFRSIHYSFMPPREDDEPRPVGKDAAKVCLVLGMDQEPYKILVKNTIKSIAPLSVVVFLLALGVLWFLVRKVTLDLAKLNFALAHSEFSATHAFPKLPEASTREVQEIISKLKSIHLQAAAVYDEMWLFMGRAAHQLKTPVTALSATLDVLLRKERTRDELLIGARDLQSAMSQMISLTEKLLTSSRHSYQLSAGPSSYQKISLDDFISSQITLFKSAADKKKVRFNIDSLDSASVRATPQLLSDTIGNLIENAILYTLENSTVTVRTSIEGKTVAVSVIDEGPGFAESVKSELFEPFVRGDERVISGSGLGLSIAHRVAKALGGDLILLTSCQSGSEMQLRLPII
jgi:signal transduction histidine kinase